MQRLSVMSSSISSTFPAMLSSRPQKLHSVTSFTLFAVKMSSAPADEYVEGDVLRMFVKEREENGDFIARASDRFWKGEFAKLLDYGPGEAPETPKEAEKISANDDGDNGGFLKLKQTREWISGGYSAPLKQKAIAKAVQDDRERRKKLNFLKYEALKGELMFLSIGIGTVCTGYCLLALSIQAAASYLVGVLFSCLYLQLLYRHADNVTKEVVPQIFMKKKAKRIGIRTEDLQDFFEMSIKGSGMALSSPRLVIPATVFGLWALSHKYLESDLLDFQIVPAMFGMFVYKAAALFQVYRDNQDLVFVFPEDEESADET